VRRAVRPDALTVLWLGREDLAHVADDLAGKRVHVSSTFLEGDLAAVPVALREGALVTHPFALPKDLPAGMARVTSWLEGRGLTVAEPRVAAQTYFACLVASEGVMHVQSVLQRDYLLDAIDHLPSAIASAPLYPRLTFGPGQRYLAKGCYVLELGGGGDVTIRDATWLPVG
jgi:hypothetical protein